MNLINNDHKIAKSRAVKQNSMCDCTLNGKNRFRNSMSLNPFDKPCRVLIDNLCTRFTRHSLLGLIH